MTSNNKINQRFINLNKKQNNLTQILIIKSIKYNHNKKIFNKSKIKNYNQKFNINNNYKSKYKKNKNYKIKLIN